MTATRRASVEAAVQPSTVAAFRGELSIEAMTWKTRAKRCVRSSRSMYAIVARTVTTPISRNTGQSGRAPTSDAATTTSARTRQRAAPIAA